MARTVASVPAGSRITHYISLGVITKFFLLPKVREVLRCLLEGVQWLLDPSVVVRVVSKSGIRAGPQSPGSGAADEALRGPCGPDHGAVHQGRLVARAALGRSG